MKTLFSFHGGALTITEQSGNLFLNLDASLGGGLWKGIITETSTTELGGIEALKNGETNLNAILPASVQPVAEVIESVLMSALTALE